MINKLYHVKVMKNNNKYKVMKLTFRNTRSSYR